jgi:hypothetical protein
MINEDLRKWVAEKWVDIGAPKKGGGFKPCGRQEGEKRKGYPKCVPLAKAHSMSKGQRKSAVKRKRAAGNAGPKPTNVSTFARKNESMNIYEQIVNLINEKVISGTPENPGTIVKLRMAQKKMGRKAAKEFAMAKEAAGTNKVGNQPQAVAHHTRRGLKAIKAGQTAKKKGGDARVKADYAAKKVPTTPDNVEDSIQRIGDLISEMMMIPVTDPSKTGYYGTNMFNELQSGKVGPFLKSNMANTPAALEKRLNRRLTGRSDRSDWAASSQRDMARLSPRGGKGFGSTLPKPAMIPGRYSSKSAYISATSPEALRSTKELNPSLDTAIQGLAKYPNDFTKSKKYVNASIERIGNLITEVAAWQRKEGKNPSGGLNKKGIASYRAANPGSKLSMAVTTKPSKLKKGSKAANRRKSFCARMGGMKKSRTSAQTANDPNSRINKALRKWNC